MGRNKNSIIGKAHRSGLPKKKRRPGENLLRQPRAKRARPKKAQFPPRPLPKPIVLPSPIPGGLHILELGEHHCRSIVGHGADGLARYCGAPVTTRPLRYRGQIIVGPLGYPLQRNLAWCEGHAVAYLNEHGNRS